MGIKKKHIVWGVSISVGVFVIIAVALLGFFAKMGVLEHVMNANKIELAADATAGKSDSSRASFLTCAAVRDRTKDFLRLHYTFRSFSEELSSRTFSQFFQALDPGKNFFLASDIERFKPFERTIPVSLARLDCHFIDEIHNLLIARVKESEALVGEVVGKALDFSATESIETDRRKLTWANSVVELKERWRKQLKFFALNMRDTELKKDEIIQKLTKRHNLILKSIEARSKDEVNGIFMNAFASSLDPHSDFELPEDQADFKVQFSLQLEGIGAQLMASDGFTVIDGIIPGGPAQRDGQMRKGDKIVAVDSGDGTGLVDVIDMDLNKVVQRIRGKKGTTVRLSILRKEENGGVNKILISLVRDVVNLPDGAAKSEVLEIDGKRIGVLNLPSFYIDYAGRQARAADFRSSARDVARELGKLEQQKVDGIVLDLRRNGGGDLSECIRMTGFFIDTGSVVQVQGRDGAVESLDDTDEGYLYKGPLAIMISKQSASASEILAGALKDYGRALIVGDSRTYGKATVQHVIEVPGSRGRESDGALKVTVSKFFQPSGGTNQAQGVLSDVQIPDVFDAFNVGEERNEYVLNRTEIRPAPRFKALQDLEPVKAKLRKRSEERVAKSKEFQELKPAIEKALKERDNTAMPLKPTEEKTPGPKKTPTPDPREAAGKVVDKNDIQLKEAARILIDSTELLGNKTDWTHP